MILETYKEVKDYYKEKATVSTYSENANFVFINGKKTNLPIIIEEEKIK